VLPDSVMALLPDSVTW